jgi:hypothetical protein
MNNIIYEPNIQQVCKNIAFEYSMRIKNIFFILFFI